MITNFGRSPKVSEKFHQHAFASKLIEINSKMTPNLIYDILIPIPITFNSEIQFKP